MKVHDLKIKPLYFQAILDGRKSFEIRYNDRNYEEGDILILRENTSGRKDGYTGRSMRCIVNFVLSGCLGLDKGYVVMSIDVCSWQTSEFSERLESFPNSLK